MSHYPEAIEESEAAPPARYAEWYASHGFSVIPVLCDGTKAPAIKWESYHHRIAPDYEIREWYHHRKLGVGIVGGHVCQCHDFGLEIMDFDDGTLFDPWLAKVKHIIDDLPVIATPGNGWHVYYRCTEIAGNTKIATDPSREKKTLIETRGKAGFVVAPGSPPECHPTGRVYKHHSGPHIVNCPVIPPSSRRELWAAARAFNRDHKAVEKLKRRIEGHRQVHNVDADPIIQTFNNRFRIATILESAGWQSRDGAKWTRPGKQFGTSATILQASDGTELVQCWSTSVGLPTDHPMNAFELCKHLFFQGDARRAYKAAAERVAR